MSPPVPPAANRPGPCLALVIAGVMAAVFLAVLWPKIASGTLWFHDELLSGNRAREIILRHDPLTVTSNFKADFKKPPLQYWFEAALLLAGENRELAIRLPSLFYGALCLPATVFLAWTISRRQARTNTWTLALPAVAVAVSGSFVHYSRIGVLDTGTGFYLALALAGCQLARDHPRWWWFVGGCCWLGAWQKAPYSFAAWVLVLVLRFLREPETTRFRSGHLWGALATSVTLTAAWFGLQFIRHGDALVLHAGQEQAGSLLRAHDPDTAGFRPYLYWWWLTRDWAAIGFLAPIAAAAALVRDWRKKEASPRLEAAAFCVVYGLVIGLTPFRVERYLTAFMPLLAIITLDWTADTLAAAGFSPRARSVLLALTVALSFPVAAFHYLKPPRGGPDSLLASAHDLRETLKPGETVLIDAKADPGFNTASFILFYADLRAPAKLLDVIRIRQRLATSPSPAYRGIESADRFRRLLNADPKIQVVSRHGDWVLWRHPGAEEISRAAAAPPARP